MRTTLTLATTLLLALPACSGIRKASGPAFQPVTASDGKGVVHFYRQSRMAGSGNAFYLRIPGNKSCVAMRNAGYWSQEVPAGALNVDGIIWGNVTKFATNVKSGEEKFIRLTFGGGFTNSVVFEEATAKDGREEIQDTLKTDIVPDGDTDCGGG